MMQLAGPPEMPFHDPRHTHASLLIAAGVQPKTIQARLGHSSITVTMDRYGHLMPSAFQGVGERPPVARRACGVDRLIGALERAIAERGAPTVLTLASR